MNIFRMNNYEIDIMQFNGIKIINTSNPNKFVKELLEGEIIINDKKIKNKTIISDLTRTKEIINFSKNSFLFNKIYNLICEHDVVNHSVLEIITNTINNEINCQILNKEEGEIKKIIDLFFEINDSYITKEIFIYFLKNLCDIENELLILNDVSFIKLVDISSYLNNLNILIVTSDFRKFLSNNTDELECIILLKNNYKYFEIVDKYKILDFIELKTSLTISNDIYKRIIDDYNSYESIRFISILHEIV